MKFKYFLILFFLILNIVSAKNYKITQIVIDAEITADGGLLVSESRTYLFDGSFSWADYELPLQGIGPVFDFSLKESGLKYEQSDTELPGSYILEQSAERLYVRWFYRAKNERRTFTVSYFVANAVTVFEDAAEFYYKFVGEQNRNSIGVVDIQIELPGLADPDSVKAWAHGPLNGEVRIQDGLVRLVVQPLIPRTFWEARIVFPPHWVPEAFRRVEQEKLPEILAEEKRWADLANQQREQLQKELLLREQNEKTALPIVYVLIMINLLLFVYFLYKYGRPHRVPFQQEIDSQPPDKRHPAMVSALYNNKQVTGYAISATLFDLARRNFLAIEQTDQKRKKFVLNLNRQYWEQKRGSLFDFENNMLAMYFDTLAGGTDQLESDLIRKNSSQMSKWFTKWSKMLKKHLKQDVLFDKSSKKGTLYSAVVSLLTGIAGIVIETQLGNPGRWAILTGFILMSASFFILRYTPEMKLKRKKWQAFRRYLKKYYYLNESNPEWTKNIGTYLVYAIALSVGLRAIKKLAEAVPVESYSSHFPWFINATGMHASPADFATAVSGIVNSTGSVISSAAGAGGGASAGGGGGAGGASGGAG